MKKGFYLKFLESKKDENKDDKESTDFVLVNETKNNDKLIVFLNYFCNIVISVIKILLYILAFILISIGITSVINPSIRGIFLSLF